MGKNKKNKSVSVSPLSTLLATLCLFAGLLLVFSSPAAGEIVRQQVLAAIIQYRVQEPDRVGVDADRIESFIRQAASRGAKIVVTPETTFYRFGVWKQNGVTQLDLAGSYASLVQRFGALSKALRICLVIGLRKPSGDANLPTYNVAVFFGPEGTVLWEHQQIVLACVFHDIRPVIPREGGHAFHVIPAACSSDSGQAVGAKRRGWLLGTSFLGVTSSWLSFSASILL